MAGSIKSVAFLLPSLPTKHSLCSSSSSAHHCTCVSTAPVFLTFQCSCSIPSTKRFATTPAPNPDPFSFSFHGSSLPFKWCLNPLSRQRCRAGDYVFPDPIPEFAETETNKFRTHMVEKLSATDIYGDSFEEVVSICTEILSKFLHTEYGGPGTLLVIPFIDMADTMNERGLPGGPEAARAAVVWAQEHVDKDWKEWTGGKSERKFSRIG